MTNDEIHDLLAGSIPEIGSGMRWIPPERQPPRPTAAQIADQVDLTATLIVAGNPTLELDGPLIQRVLHMRRGRA